MKFIPKVEFDDDGRVRSVEIPWGFFLILILLSIIS